MLRFLPAVIAALLLSACAVPGMRVGPETTPDLRPPPALRAADGEIRQVPLIWQPARSQEVRGYVIERKSPDGGPFERVATVRGRFTNAWVDQSATADAARYRYRIRSVGPGGIASSATSPIVTGVTAGPPRPPRGVRAISHLPRRIAVQWRPASDPRVGGYVIQRSAAADGPFIEVARPGNRFSTTWVDDDLGNLRVFYYRVASVNRAGAIGEPGPYAQAVTKAEPLPPLDLRVVAKRLGATELAWEPNVEEDVAGYRLLRRPSEGGAEHQITTLPTDAIRAEDTDVAAGRVFVYRLIAFDFDGLESAPSDPVEVRGEGYELDAIPEATRIALSWNPRREEGFEGARVYRMGLFRRQELARVEGRDFVDADVEPGRTYRYSVVLERPDGTRAPASSVVEAAIPAAP